MVLPHRFELSSPSEHLLMLGFEGKARIPFTGRQSDTR